MGWTVSNTLTQREMIERYVARLNYTTEDGDFCRVLERHEVPEPGQRVVYLLCEHNTTTHPKRTDRSVFVHLHEGSAVKQLHETEHPYYYDIPKGWLERLTEPLNPSAAEWRALVRRND